MLIFSSPAAANYELDDTQNQELYQTLVTPQQQQTESAVQLTNEDDQYYRNYTAISR